MTDLMGLGILFVFPAATAVMCLVLHYWFTKA